MDSKWKYNKESHTVDQQPTMEYPTINGGVAPNEVLEKYHQHIASLRSIPVSGNCSWIHRQDLAEGKDFSIVDGVFNVYTGFVCFASPASEIPELDWAYHQIKSVIYPIKQEQPQISEEAMIAHAMSKKSLATVLKNQSQDQPEIEYEAYTEVVKIAMGYNRYTPIMSEAFEERMRQIRLGYLITRK